MDGDLQNDPGGHPGNAERRSTKTPTWSSDGARTGRIKLLTRKIPSWIANRLIGKVTGVPIRDNGCSLKLYRAERDQAAFRFTPRCTGSSRRWLRSWARRVKEVPVSASRAPAFGASKYGLSRTCKVLLDLLSIKTIIGFAQRPLLWFGAAGAAIRHRLPGMRSSPPSCHSSRRAATLAPAVRRHRFAPGRPRVLPRPGRRGRRARLQPARRSADIFVGFSSASWPSSGDVMT